jgi:preprotein translocase subunit SecG
MNFKNVICVVYFDNTQLSLADLSTQIQQAIQAQFNYVVFAVTTTVLVQAQWLAGAFQNGSNQIAIALGVPAGVSDSTVATNVAFVISTLFMPLSTTPTVVNSATVFDTSAAPSPGPPNPTAEPTNGNP